LRSWGKGITERENNQQGEKVFEGAIFGVKSPWQDATERPINSGQKKSASLLLTTECAITDIPEKKEAPAMPGGGMGGMGGMDY